MAAKTPKKKTVAKKVATKKVARRRRTSGSADAQRAKNSRSGYARDKQPHLVDAKEAAHTLPPRAGGGFSGGQEGRPLPSEREYKPGVYKTVSAQEAQINMVKRSAGSMEPISGGLDDDVDVEAARIADKHDLEESPDNIQPFEAETDFEPGSPALAAEEARLAAKAAAAPAAPYTGPLQVKEGIITADNKLAEYVAKRSRVTLELPHGTMTLPIIDIIPSQYSVTLLLPMSSEGATFIPNPGSEVKLTQVSGSEINEWACFYPGASFEIPELGITGIVFVRS